MLHGAAVSDLVRRQVRPGFGLNRPGSGCRAAGSVRRLLPLQRLRGDGDEGVVRSQWQSLSSAKRGGKDARVLTGFPAVIWCTGQLVIGDDPATAPARQRGNGLACILLGNCAFLGRKAQNFSSPDRSCYHRLHVELKTQEA